MEAGRPFAAHEVLEARWKAGPVDERDLWQGLAQVCVAITHAARGNQSGADRLADRADTTLAVYVATGRPTYGADLTAVMECARRRVTGRGSSNVQGAPPDMQKAPGRDLPRA